MSILETHSLTKIYHTNEIPVQALKNVEMEVKEGDFRALVGPSGSGKTTLLNLVGGLDRPTSGRIYFVGKEIGSLTKRELTELRLYKIGFIFQDYNLIPVLSAQENVEFVMLLQKVGVKERARKARAVLEEVGLSGLADRRPGELSGGQQQRVAVARAIVSEPVLILADEPTANLDSETGASLMELLRDLNQQKQITFIFSTHDPMVMERAKQLVFLKDGEIVDVVDREAVAQ